MRCLYPAAPRGDLHRALYVRAGRLSTAGSGRRNGTATAAAGRLFLRKVGGGYMFIHRYLLEHFAAMGEEARAPSTPSEATERPVQKNSPPENGGSAA